MGKNHRHPKRQYSHNVAGLRQCLSSDFASRLQLDRLRLSHKCAPQNPKTDQECLNYPQRPKTLNHVDSPAIENSAVKTFETTYDSW